MNNKEKLQIIKIASNKASQMVYELKEILREAEEETGYEFGYKIMQEVEDGYMHNLRAELEGIANGDENEHILEELKY